MVECIVIVDYCVFVDDFVKLILVFFVWFVLMMFVVCDWMVGR